MATNSALRYVPRTSALIALSRPPARTAATPRLFHTGRTRATTTAPAAIGAARQRLYSQPRSRPFSCTSARAEDKSFRGQLYNSTSERLGRERAEQAQLAAKRNIGGGGGSMVFLFVMITSLGFGYWIGTQRTPEPDGRSTLPLDSARPPQHNTAPVNLQAAWADFRDIVGEENVSTDPGETATRAGSDWSTYTVAKEEIPFAVVKPATTEEVSAIMKVCHARRIPVTAYSGGTSLEGHFAPTRGGICIDFSRMDKVLALHKDDLDVVVQPAVGWERLNEELGEHGLFFAPDPGPGAMIGGMVGTGCSGTNAYRYGTMKEWVLSLTVVLADGTVVKTRQRPRKSSGGYDLTRVFVGSEGTLGLVTEATLKVVVKPANESVAVGSFGSVREAAECVFSVVGAGVPIAAIEILDEVQMRCINDAGMTSRVWKEAPTLFFKFAGTPTAVKEHIAIVQRLAKQAGSRSFEFAKSKQEADDLWSARKEALWSVTAQQRDGDHVWTTDVAVPISRLPQIIEETKGWIGESGLVASIVGHVGDGNFHSIILYNDREQKKAEDLVHKMVKRAIELEGTSTGEHGIGLVKRDYLPHELGQSTVDAMRKLKQAFDPLCLLNCDKVVRVQQPKPGEVQEW